MKLTKSQLDKIKKAIANHDKYDGCYFWTPPCNASQRRGMEKRDTFAVAFRNAGRVYEYTSEVSCSCKSVYYTGVFSIDGERVNVAEFRRLA